MGKEYNISHKILGTLVNAFYNWNSYLRRPINNETHPIGINMLLTEYEEEEARIKEENAIVEEMKLYDKLKAKYGK